MSPIANGRVIYQNHPSSYPVPGTTVWDKHSQSIDLDNVSLNGGCLLKMTILSSDPYMRTRMRAPDVKDYIPPFTIGTPIQNFGVAVILRTEDAKYVVGDHIYGVLPFEEYSVCRDGEGPWPWLKLENPESLPWSLYVGVLGMSGQTAYMGWKALAEEKAQKSRTLFVSGGAGAVGSIVIQLAKKSNRSLKIIASASSEQKMDFLRSIGADVVFNYREENASAVLDIHGPIDMCWDNVAGHLLDSALENMADNGLVVACGEISGYNEGPMSIKNFGSIFKKSIAVRGFRVADFYGQYIEEFYSEVTRWILEGDLRYIEHRYMGLENAHRALQDVQTGSTFGKAVIIVSNP